MSASEKWVTTSDALLAAIGEGVGKVVVSGRLSNVPSLRLSPGQSLCGAAEDSKIAFTDAADGVELTSDNAIHNVHLCTGPERRAVFNDTSVATLGRVQLRGVSTQGRVQILARDRVRGGHIEVNGLDIVAADARAERERPHGYGVSVLQGALTLWNMQRDEDVALSADLVGISAGREGAPVRGGGVFVGGAGNAGGRVIVRRLETGPVYSDGGIARDTPDCISGGVFVIFGAFADSVHNRGPVTTYGPNDMVLDNWGTVDRWTADEKVTSHGPSGIGFVNFGTIDVMRPSKPSARAHAASTFIPEQCILPSSSASSLMPTARSASRSASRSATSRFTAVSRPSATSKVDEPDLMVRTSLMHGVGPQCAVEVVCPSSGGEAGGRSLGFIS
jgi:hypothetical protein